MSWFEQRVDRLRERLIKDSLDGLLVSNLTNVHYLSGFTGSAGTCIILLEKAYFISDGRYLLQSKDQVKGMEIFIDSKPHVEIYRENNLIPNGATIGFEANYLVISQMEQLKELFPRSKWKSTTRWVEDISAVKDLSELRTIRTAVEITDRTFDQILPEIRPGVTEREIASKISYTHRMFGADGDAFEPIVAAGPNSALPHAVPSDREFQEGDFVIIDFGAKYGGYCADMTRTVVVGHATDKQKEMYEVIKKAQQQGCDMAKAGIMCKELDSVTRNTITEKGYGDYFVHNTGHGLGMEVHEMPRLSPLSNDTILENYVVTIEPGIYISQLGGVRIEDDVVIQKDGCEILNSSTRELLVLK